MVARVTVVPLSGYVNRLQAMVSASLLAQDLGADWQVCWRRDDVAAAGPDALLAAEALDLRIVDAAEASRRAGTRLDDVPLYLEARGHAVTLRGHDRGEQAFMPALRALLEQRGDVADLVIVAGGKFTLGADAAQPGEPPSDEWRAFAERRRQAYGAWPWPETVLRAAVPPAHPYVGLHLRYTDRSHEAPASRSIERAVRDATAACGTRSVLVAGDREAMRERWSARLRAAGLEPWTTAPSTFDRSRAASATGAMADWLLLARSVHVVHFGASSFGEEAAVAAGAGTALAPDAVRRAVVPVGRVLRDIATYPWRRWG